MGNIVRFRRLKWGAPKPWWRSLADAPTRRQRARLPLGTMAIGFVLSAMGFSLLFSGELGALAPAAPAALLASADTERATFGLCVRGAGSNCVIDGDTFRYRGAIVRIADIDTPEVRNFQCAAEKARGDAATRRLHALLNAGPFTLQRIARDTDVYGRKLRVVTRAGDSLGMVLVAEGLAHVWGGGKRGWC